MAVTTTGLKFWNRDESKLTNCYGYQNLAIKRRGTGLSEGPASSLGSIAFIFHIYSTTFVKSDLSWIMISIYARG